MIIFGVQVRTAT